MRERTDTSPGNEVLTRTQGIALDMEERLTELVTHAKMLKKLKQDLQDFQSATSSLLGDIEELIDDLALVERSRDENEFTDEIEVSIFQVLFCNFGTLRIV